VYPSQLVTLPSRTYANNLCGPPVHKYTYPYIHTLYRFYIYPHLVESNSPFRYIYIHAAAPCAIASEQQKTEEAQYLIVKYQQSINLRCKAKQTKPKTKRRRFNYMKSTHIQNCLPRNKNKIDKTHSIQNVYKK